MFKYAAFLIALVNLFSYADVSNNHFLIETEVGQKPIRLKPINKEKYSELPNTAVAKERDYSSGVVDFAKSKSAFQLAPNVPILDQGYLGTCVTFSTTMAIDAVLKLGDGISQQCSLMLSEALGNPIWDGAYYPSEVLDPLKAYGAVRQNACGFYFYPDRSQISFAEYAGYVDPSIDMSKVQYMHYSKVPVEQVKSALKQGKYVAIGFGLVANGDPKSVQGFDVSVNGVKRVGGLWACKQKSSSQNYCSVVQAGHEVIIVGYDDKQRLLKIQNSWGVSNGDSGYYYMTYEFFASMQDDATEIWAQ